MGTRGRYAALERGEEVNEKKLLYQMTTKDGIKSEIREADKFMPDLRFAICPNLTTMSFVEHQDLSVSKLEERRYRMRRHYAVEFIEYEEV